jgi:hypothetical protein
MLLVHIVFIIDAHLWTPDEITLAYARVNSSAQYWQTQGYDIEIEPSTLWEVRQVNGAENARRESLDQMLYAPTAKRGTLYIMRDMLWLNPYGWARCGGSGIVLNDSRMFKRVATHEIGHMLCLGHEPIGIMRGVE